MTNGGNGSPNSKGKNMIPLYADLETFSTTELKQGAHKYAEAAEILLFPYALGDEEPKCWIPKSGAHPGEPTPPELRDALMNQNKMTVWHNGGMFDLVILNHVRPSGMALPHDRVFDTMACAYAHSLPGSLDTLCTVLGVDAAKAKLKTGKQLIQLFCKPRPKNIKLRRATSATHPEEWAAFIEYAKADITSMREVYKKLPKWNYKWREGFEYNLWLLDQRINNRGVAVDVPFAEAAIRAADVAREDLAARAQQLTHGAVQAATQRDAMLEHLFEEYAVQLPDMRADTLERRLQDPDLPEGLKELLRVRLQATSTSVRKYNSLVGATSSDGRLRGLLQWNGAARTGRWCLAAGSKVLVRNDMGRVVEKAIEDVELSDEVWDGEAWVHHEGVVFSGDKNVIEHDGVTATPEHKVYLSASRYVTLGEAKEKGYKIWRGSMRKEEK